MMQLWTEAGGCFVYMALLKNSLGLFGPNYPFNNVRNGCSRYKIERYKNYRRPYAACEYHHLSLLRTCERLFMSVM